MLDNLLDIRCGGQVTRYHTMTPVRRETNAEHTWSCLVLLDRLYPEAGVELRRYVLYHDVTEGLTGDTPWPAKRQSKALWDALHGLELQESLRLDLPLITSLTGYEQDWFRLVDALDCCFYALDQAMLGHKGFENVFSNGLMAARRSALLDPQKASVARAAVERAARVLKIINELEQAAAALHLSPSPL